MRKKGAQTRDSINKVIENLKSFYDVTAYTDCNRVKADIKIIFEDDSESTEVEVKDKTDEEKLFKAPKLPPPTRQQKSEFITFTCNT